MDKTSTWVGHGLSAELAYGMCVQSSFQERFLPWPLELPGLQSLSLGKGNLRPDVHLLQVKCSGKEPGVAWVPAWVVLSLPVPNRGCVTVGQSSFSDPPFPHQEMGIVVFSGSMWWMGGLQRSL